MGKRRVIRAKYDDGTIETCYESLCLAIIEQAIKDYKKALEAEKRCEDLNVKREVRKLEKFFRSEWFAQLSNLDGRLLIKNVRKIILN